MRPPVLLLAVLGGVLPAQQNVKWLADNQPSGNGNAFPWGSVHIRYQTIFDAAVLGNVPGFVNDILVAGDSSDTTPREVLYEDIEIRLGNTAVTHAGLTQNWTTNNPNPQTVYRGPLRTVFERNAWRGLGLPWAFPYVPLAPAPNLCVEVIVRRVRGLQGPRDFFYPTSGFTIHRAFEYDWVSTQAANANVDTYGSKFGLLLDGGNYVLLGQGCNSSSAQRLTISGPVNAWPARGQPFPVGLGGGAPLRPSLLLLGTSDVAFGSIALPIDLRPFGGGTCQVWSEPLMSIGAVSDGSGNAAVTVPIPVDPALSLGRVFATWTQLDPGANALGLGWSNYMKLILDR